MKQEIWYCPNCNLKNNGKSCKNCGWSAESEKTRKKEPSPQEALAIQQKKDKRKADAVVALIFAVLTALVVTLYVKNEMSERASKRTNSYSYNISSSKYLTDGTWSLESTTYCFAVEVDSYNGDIYESGTYIFGVTNDKLGEAPMYDIYIENNEVSKYELKTPDYTVGGAGDTGTSIYLPKNSYVYIVPVDMVYSPKGFLVFSK